MIAEAQVRSATFRRLVDAIDATDGIVYVEEGNCHHRVRACLPPLVTTTDEFRFLRVLVDARQDDWQVMSDIGHELQHALEVLVHPNARTNADVFFVFDRDNVGSSSGSVGSKELRETQAAVAAGDDIKKELKAFATSNSTKGLSRNVQTAVH